MRILGIDTSTRFLCIGIYDDKSGSYEYRMDLHRKHSLLILPTIKRILDSLKIKPPDIDYFAVGLGPGSFTGIRIGLSVIKGLVYALKKSVVGISSLDILALNAKTLIYSEYRLSSHDEAKQRDDMFRLKGTRVCPIIDAKRNLIFCSLYTINDGHLKRKMPYKLITLEELINKVPAKSIFLGDALKLYRDRITTKIKRAYFLDEDFWYPKAVNIIELAKERINKNKIDDIKTIRPIYLYPKECQVKNVKIKGQ